MNHLVQVILLNTGNLEPCPGRIQGHLDHDPSIRVETFEVANLGGVKVFWGLLAEFHCKIIWHLLEKFSRPRTRSFRILPIRSTLVTIPVAMNVAETLIASDANSADESAANAGVRADPIWAWYCSRRDASVKSGSGVLPNI